MAKKKKKSDNKGSQQENKKSLSGVKQPLLDKLDSSPAKQLDSYLLSVAIGLRYQTNFQLADKFGEITNNLLHSSNNLFSPDVFPAISSEIDKRVLLDGETKNSLEISLSNILLDYETDLDNASTDIIDKAFIKYLIEEIANQYKIRNFLRIGYARRYLFKEPSLVGAFLKKVKNISLPETREFSCKFSEKLPMPATYLDRSKEYYQNVIFTIIKKANLNEIYISVDFQRYLNPPVSTANELKFEGFLDVMRLFNHENFVYWIKDIMRDSNG